MPSMETINLPLFIESNPVAESVQEPDINNIPSPDPPQAINPLAQIEQTLSAIFPDNEQENKAYKARKILGETASSLSDEKLGNLVTDFDYLIDTWLDLFEKRLFQGKTLREVLGEPVYGSTK